MKRAVVACLTLIAAMLGAVPTAQADPVVPTGYFPYSDVDPAGNTYVAVRLVSPDARCALGRVVRISEKVDAVLVLRGQDKTVYSGAAGIRIPPLTGPARLAVPATTLPDGTKCGAGESVTGTPARQQGTATLQRQILQNPEVWVADQDFLGGAVLAGRVADIKACRTRRTVRFETATNPAGPWTSLGKDATGTNGVFGIAALLPSGLSIYRVSVKKKKLPNGHVCAFGAADVS